MSRNLFLFVFLLGASTLLQAQGRWSFRGTVVKMRMGECAAQRGFMTMSGGAGPTGLTCPEFTVMSEKVVYVVVGRRAEDFIPLAENMDFLIRKNELVFFSDDEKTKSHFTIQQMTMRADWEREEARKELMAKMMERNANREERNPQRASMFAVSAR